MNVLPSDKLSVRQAALRRLFREVAKRVHPDLASEEADRRRREGLMRDANSAFERADANTLLAILEQSDLAPAAPPARSATDPETVVRSLRKLTIRVRIHLTFLERYEDEAMQRSRGVLARHLLALSPRDAIREEVMNFFEDLDLFIHDQYVDENLVWTAFGFCATRWWAACENYVSCERTERNDPGLLAGFERLAARFARQDEQAAFKKPGAAEVIGFLEDERRLLR